MLPLISAGEAGGQKRMSSISPPNRLQVELSLSCAGYQRLVRVAGRRKEATLELKAKLKAAFAFTTLSELCLQPLLQKRKRNWSDQLVDPIIATKYDMCALRLFFFIIYAQACC
jgi:hypothetical protein